jgi:hypothetical protein
MSAPAVVAALVSHGSRLQRLELDQPQNVILPTELFIDIGKLPHLVSLSLFPNIPVMDQILSNLLQHNIHLEEIYIKQCELSDEGGMKYLGEKLPQLKTLSLTFYKYKNDMTEAGIIFLVQNNHNLQDIHINHTAKLTDACLFYIAQYCPHLKKIHLFTVKEGFTTEGYTELFNQCEQLVDMKSIAFLTGIYHNNVPVKIQLALKRRKVCQRGREGN